MNNPWINLQRVRPNEMTVFKFSTLKKQDEFNALNLRNIEDDQTETGDDISELVTTLTNTPDAIANNSFVPAELMDEMKETIPAKISCGMHIYDQGKVCYLTKNSPFSVHVEIDDFLHEPICGDIAQNTFEYHDLNNKKAPEFDTQLIHTTTYYPEQPECRLVCSKIHEIVFLGDDQHEGTNSKGNHYQSVAVPMHDPLLFTKAEESNNNSYVNVRVPVVLGEYKIEICLEEKVIFKEDVMRIRGISKEVVITNFRLVPTLFSQTLNNGTHTAIKGNLFIEGYICQKIEYTAMTDKLTESVTPLNQLHQKMVAELIIHILQVQQVRVKR
jgi:hypothetical protein